MSKANTGQEISLDPGSGDFMTIGYEADKSSVVSISPAGTRSLVRMAERLQCTVDQLMTYALDLYFVAVQELAGPENAHKRMAIVNPDLNVMFGVLTIGGINEPLMGLVASDGRPL